MTITDIKHRWTKDQLAHRQAAEHGRCVVANVRTRGGKAIDGALIKWADVKARDVRIDLGTMWGNDYVNGRGGDRDTVVAKFKDDFLRNENLLWRLLTLRGKVLMCWCHPLRCHGNIVAEAVNSLG